MTLVTSHLNKMWTEISSSVPHYLHVGLLLSPIIYKRLLKVLCPVKCLFVKADFLKKKYSLRHIFYKIHFSKCIFQSLSSVVYQCTVHVHNPKLSVFPCQYL